MESTAKGDDDLSSMADHSPAAAGSSSGIGECSAASEESGWTTYIDYFMATQQHFVEEATSCSACTSPSTNADESSESVGDHGAGGGVVASFTEAARLPALVDSSSEAWRRSSLRRKEAGVRRMKLMRRDEFLELEDTATSPISSPKKASDELDFDDNRMNNIENGEDVSTDIISDADAYGKLRKKGLCLVPVSICFHSL